MVADAQPRPYVHLLVVVAASMTGFAFSDFYTFRLKEPRGPHDSKVDSSFHVQELQVSELSGEIYSWHHDHIPLLKFLFARGVACVVFSSSRNIRLVQK